MRSNPGSAALSEALLTWHADYGRAHLPWRTHRDPYRVVVSELMLQQTQVERVLPAFERFVRAFPSFVALAAVSRADAVRAWKGLGYNARAVRLHRLAQTVRDRFGGTLPRDEVALRSLPGVGPYSARAIMAFAFDADVVAFDTNVRRVVQRTCFGLEWPVAAGAAELERVGAELIPPGRGCAFNSALMDLGAAICTARAPRCLVCPLRAACAAAPVDPAQLAALAARHGAPKSPGERIPFRRSTRFVRGRIIDRLRELGPDEKISLLDLERELTAVAEVPEGVALVELVRQLAGDGVIEDSDQGLRLAR